MLLYSVKVALCAHLGTQVTRPLAARPCEICSLSLFLLCIWIQAAWQVGMMEVVAAGLRRAGREENAEREVIRS